jgi:transposase
MKQQQRYTPEFRTEAVKLVTEQGLSQKTAAQRLAIPKGTLANWVAAAKAPTRPAVPGARTAPELEAENARLRKELAETRMERDILKKATAYFARESLPGTRS